jgi:putative transposase
VHQHSTKVFGIDIVGYLKGKSAIAIARQFGRGKNFTGEVFWARGYFASTVGLDEATVRLTYASKSEKTNVTTR